jgi:hypothetical protein
MRRMRRLASILPAVAIFTALLPAAARADYPTTDQAVTIARNQTYAPSNGALGLPSLRASNGIRCSADVLYLNASWTTGLPFSGQRHVLVSWWDNALFARMQWQVDVSGTSGWPVFLAKKVTIGASFTNGGSACFL